MNEKVFQKLRSEGPLKILIVSQKGGVGKSTLSANFSAYCGRILKRKTVLLDCDPHASASMWLKALRPENVEVKHHLIDDFTAQRWFIGMRNVIRKNLTGCEFLVCDLTWTKSMSAEFVKEFDLIVIPTSVSLIEIDATNIFIEQNLKKISKMSPGISTPDLLICPSQVIDDELKLNPFNSRTFDFPFFLLPPIPCDPEIRSLFEKGYAFETNDVTATAYKKVFESILQAGRLKKGKYVESCARQDPRLSSSKLDINERKQARKVNHKTTIHDTNNVGSVWKDSHQVDKVKKILKLKKKEKSSWLRRLVSW